MWLNEWKHTAVFGLSNRNETTMQLYSLGNLLSLLFAKPEEKQMLDYIWNRDYKHLQNQTSRILAPFHCRCRVASWITAIPSGSVAAFAISGSFKKFQGYLRILSRASDLRASLKLQKHMHRHKLTNATKNVKTLCHAASQHDLKL